jgi:hypothetical protein
VPTSLLASLAPRFRSADDLASFFFGQGFQLGQNLCESFFGKRVG